MSTPVVIYGAKSTEDKHGSIETQLEDCRVMAAREGWDIVGEFSDEAFSAYHGNRGPGLAQAKAKAIEHAPSVLVAQDADRFARGAGDAPGAADHLGELFFAMRRQGVSLWSVRTGELDDLHAVVLGNRARDETARKAQAVRAGIQRRRAKGKAWGEPPLGYRVQRRSVRTSRSSAAAWWMMRARIFPRSCSLSSTAERPQEKWPAGSTAPATGPTAATSSRPGR